jgi:DNA-binding PadR family transcriptional regulator
MSGRTGRGSKGTWVQLLILRILYETQIHGYALIEKINSYQSGRRPIQPGSLYTILRRMEKDGLLESTWDDKNSRLNRRVYKLTESGENRLREGRIMVTNQLNILHDLEQFYDNQFTDTQDEAK